MDDDSRVQRDLLADALALLASALDLLDRAEAPGQIGAHVDLALNQLAALLQPDSGTGAVKPLEQRLLRH